MTTNAPAETATTHRENLVWTLTSAYFNRVSISAPITMDFFFVDVVKDTPSIVMDLAMVSVIIAVPSTTVSYGPFIADTDECANSMGGCHHTCTNQEGDFVCSCRDGYALGEDGQTCNDIDECSNGGGCDHLCVNLPGRFICECREGYLLDATDGRSCNGQ